MARIANAVFPKQTAHMKTFLALLALCVSVIAADESLSKTIDSLLKSVETSDCKFVRNGDEHTGKEAAEHMRRKYDHFKKQIKTTDDFIEKCASKSELSGKPYMIKLPDGAKVKAEDWMHARLKEQAAK
jgi:hypothetical protein